MYSNFRQEKKHQPEKNEKNKKPAIPVREIKIKTSFSDYHKGFSLSIQAAHKYGKIEYSIKLYFASLFSIFQIFRGLLLYIHYDRGERREKHQLCATIKKIIYFKCFSISLECFGIAKYTF